MNTAPATLQALLAEVENALQSNNAVAASHACRQLIALFPKEPRAHYSVGLTALESRDLGIARKAFHASVGLKPDFWAGWAQLARTFALLGSFENSHKALQKIVARSKPEDGITASVADIIALTYALLGDHVAAKPWHLLALAGHGLGEHAVARFNLNWARCCVFLGDDAMARAALDEASRYTGLRAEALWMKSRLKGVDGESEIPALKLALSEVKSPQEQAYCGYGLAKLYEDKGDWGEAFDALTLAAAGKRSSVSYDEAQELAGLDSLAQVFNAGWWAHHQREATSDHGPIFITGLPRTGSTLVERILGAHSTISPLGELQHFQGIMRAALGMKGQGAPTPDQAKRIAALRPAQIGKDYKVRVGTSWPSIGGFTDKLPPNFNYAPMILAAIPNARIIYVERDPLDACFAIYKHLFADAYPWSYDLGEIGRYYAQHRRLFDHYKLLLKDRLICVRYEMLTTNPRDTVAQLCRDLGLGFEDAMLAFHKQKSAVATASAAQVREKAHTRSIGRARQYGDKLATLIDILRRNNIEFA